MEQPTRCFPSSTAERWRGRSPARNCCRWRDLATALTELTGTRSPAQSSPTLPNAGARPPDVPLGPGTGRRWPERYPRAQEERCGSEPLGRLPPRALDARASGSAGLVPATPAVPTCRARSVPVASRHALPQEGLGGVGRRVRERLLSVLEAPDDQ